MKTGVATTPLSSRAMFETEAPIPTAISEWLGASKIHFVEKQIIQWLTNNGRLGAFFAWQSVANHIVAGARFHQGDLLRLPSFTFLSTASQDVTRVNLDGFSSLLAMVARNGAGTHRMSCL